MCNKNALRLAWLTLVAALLVCAANADAQRRQGEVDLAIMYQPVRSNTIAGQSFWQQGGAVELSAETARGIGLTAFIAGATASNINGSGVNSRVVTTVFGPRYTWRSRHIAIFGEGLIGEANGFDGVYPNSSPNAKSANAAYDSFATQVGGGIDIPLHKHFALRAVQASWLRTQFPNATTNVQNQLQVGAGVVLRLR